MHHDESFRDFIWTNGRYTNYPELVEFYAGIDRRRADAVSVIMNDLKKMNQGFVERTGIDSGFNPFARGSMGTGPTDPSSVARRSRGKRAKLKPASAGQRRRRRQNV